MQIYAKKLKIKPRKAFWIILLLLCSLGRGSALSICIPNMSRITIAFFIVILVLFVIKDKGKIRLSVIKNNPYPLIFIVLLIPSMLVNHGNNNDLANIILIVSVLIAYIISIYCTQDDLIENYIQTVYVLCIISMVCFVLFSILNLPTGWMLHLQKQSDVNEEFRSILLYSIRLKDSERNCGPFWEPSIFAAYISFALVFQLFISKKPVRKRVIVFILTIVTTMSTGGAVLLIMIALLWIWRKRKGDTVAVILTLIFAGAVVLFGDSITNMLLNINYPVFSKIVFFRNSKSSMSRIYSILINLEIWRKSPLLGVGLAQVEELYHSTNMSSLAVSLLQLRPSQSATPFIFLAGFGICGAYYSYLWIKACASISVFSNIQKVLYGLIVFFVVTETPHTQFILTFYIICVLLHKDTVHS